MVKSPAAKEEVQVPSLGWEDPLEKEKGYLLQYFCLENSKDRIAHGVAKSQTQLSNFHSPLLVHRSHFGKDLQEVLSSQKPV